MWSLVGERGTCYKKREAPCKRDLECPPGTFCSWVAGRRICEACPSGNDQSTSCVKKAIAEALTRHDASAFQNELKEEDLKESLAQYREWDIRAVQARPGADLHSLLFGVRALQQITSASSRSGATLYSAESYIIKGFTRVEEYNELVETIESHNPGSNGTIFNLPLLVFPAFYNSYWAVMSNIQIDALRQLGVSKEDKSIAPLLMDVKPGPIYSADRNKLLALLKDIRFQVSPSERLDNFMQTVNRDIEYLDSRGLVDYSWMVVLVEMPVGFEMPKALLRGSPEVGQPWCFLSSPRFVSADYAVAQNRKPRVVACFAVIDYSLAYKGAAMAVESTFMSFKWENYGTKFKQFTHCLFALGADKAAVRQELGISIVHTVLDEKKGIVGVMLGHPQPFLQDASPCFEHRRAVCAPHITQFSECSPERCNSRVSECSLRFQQSMSLVDMRVELDYCLAYIVERCAMSNEYFMAASSQELELHTSLATAWP
eukprot:TRINITY_DN1821_c0_g1_i1.p1 TRINITY_DN1821_c0_g1~~TRINITY_DN1821_c0_g1_i1.p1  ORF type:complete len:487 (+),score=72.99 TRINITY_DN1821_c0_g1_i1:211-1671(+)